MFSHNPQANGMIERVHQAVRNSLRTPEASEEAEVAGDKPWDDVSSQAAWVPVQSTHHTALEATLGQLVSSHDVLLPIQS